MFSATAKRTANLDIKYSPAKDLTCSSSGTTGYKSDTNLRSEICQLVNTPIRIKTRCNSREGMRIARFLGPWGHVCVCGRSTPPRPSGLTRRSACPSARPARGIPCPAANAPHRAHHRRRPPCSGRHAASPDRAVFAGVRVVCSAECGLAVCIAERTRGIKSPGGGQATWALHGRKSPCETFF